MARRSRDEITTGEATPLPRRRKWRVIGPILLVIALLVIWETAKFVGGDPWRFSTEDGAAFNFSHDPPLEWRIASDRSLPHAWDVVGTLTRPVQRDGPPLAAILAEASLYTLRNAAFGFVLGASFGLLLGIALIHARLLERAIVPYVVASQTIPIIAIAPVLVIGLRVGEFAVALVAAYLTFFPVTIATLRGLRSADPRAFELMRSLAAGRASVLWKLRLPASAPYLFTAFKISASAAIVGAIVGELPAGVRDGLGGALLNFNQYYTIAPERLWAALLFAAALGILCFSLAVLAERIAMRGYRPVEEVA